MVCNIDGTDYTFKNSHIDESYIALNLIKGKHILQLKRKTLYNLLFCYLNIFNPIFYIWEIMFLEHRKEELKKSFSIFEIEFELLSQKAPYIILDFNSVIRYDDLVINMKIYNNEHPNYNINYKSSYSDVVYQYKNKICYPD